MSLSTRKTILFNFISIDIINRNQRLVFYCSWNYC